MLTNFHTHTTYCDGENTPEEVVLAAIECGFDALGFSGHGYTGPDTIYCMQDTEGYIKEINRLKEKYQSKIQIYLGIEEDSSCEVNRDALDYIIGSMHYFKVDGKTYPIDLAFECLEKCLEIFEYDIEALTQNYYSHFCEYILRRKPDIIGHFDLITKFDEMYGARFLHNDNYNKIAEKYIKEALKSDCIFEVNTGAISRGYRTTPYPSENLLYVLKKNNAKVMLSSDSHSVKTLDFGFAEAKKLLKNVGFEYVYALYNNEWTKDFL